MQANARRWTRDEVLLAMNLYCRIPFGRQHKTAPEVVELAAALGRTPSSVAMKLNNLTSLDPDEQARGVRGLPGASDLDRQVWDEFHADWDALAAESEALWGRMVSGDATEEGETSAATDTATTGAVEPPDAAEAAAIATGPTEARRLTRVRLSQAFFRRVVLSAYGSRCCITGNPVASLLDAAHIVSWSATPEHRTNPRNGLCMTRLHHAALDQGLITFDEEHRLVVSRRIREHLPNEALESAFTRYEGEPMQLPERFRPRSEFLASHRTEVFLG